VCVQFAALAISLASASARAAAPIPPFDGASDCPSRAAVERELRPLLGEASLSAETSSRIRIDDYGDTYRVGVEQSERVVSDPERNCAERAKVSAVFIALNLPSRRAAAGAQPEPAVTPRVEPEPRVDAEPPSANWRLLLRGLAGVEHAPEPARLATGVTLGAGFWRGRLGAGLSAGVQTPVAIASSTDPSATYELWRLPASLTLGYGVEAGRLGAAVEGGLALDLLRFRGLTIPNPDVGLRLNAGVRVSLVLRLRASRSLAALLMPTLAYYPRSYLVRLEPTRLLGESPRIWWGAGVGLESSILGG
jgi:hypothetical protein